MITCGSIFSGVGGWEVGAGWHGIKPRFAVELDPDRCAIHRMVHPRCPVYEGSVLDKAILGAVPHVDILFSSPPCQAHSSARNKSSRKRNDDWVGEITVEYAKRTNAKIVFVENVERYKNHPSCKAIVRGLEDLGYTVDIHLVKAEEIGTPSKRRRMLLRAAKGRLPPWPGDPGLRVSWHDVCKDLLKDLKPAAPLPPYHQKCLAPWKGTFQFPVWIHGGARNGLRVHANRGDPAPVVMSSPRSMTGSRIWMKDGRLLKVTPRMAFRVMGFPDPPIPGLDDTLGKARSIAFQVAGNAVCPTFASYAIAPFLAR